MGQHPEEKKDVATHSPVRNSLILLDFQNETHAHSADVAFVIYLTVCNLSLTQFKFQFDVNQPSLITIVRLQYLVTI